MSEISEVLGAQPFFFGMSNEQMEAVSACASPAEFAAGSAIFHAGGNADSCYLILAGDVALELVAPGRGPHVIQTLHEGEILGWSWIFPPYTWSFDAQALSDVKVVCFDAAMLRAAKEDDPALGYALLSRFTQVIIDRMQAARLQLMDIYGTPR